MSTYRYYTEPIKNCKYCPFTDTRRAGISANYGNYSITICDLLPIETCIDGEIITGPKPAKRGFRKDCPLHEKAGL